jgi:hypothetical protein
MKGGSLGLFFELRGQCGPPVFEFESDVKRKERSWSRLITSTAARHQGMKGLGGELGFLLLEGKYQRPVLRVTYHSEQEQMP